MVRPRGPEHHLTTGGLAALLLFLGIWSHPLMAAQLELRQAGDGVSQTRVLVGEIIDVEVWVDSEGAEISGAAIFLSFDESVFALVDEDQEPAQAGFQPFARGGFLANGEVFRNAWLAPGDPAASPLGEQIDYSVVRASGTGQGRVASFRLRARAPSTATDIRIDETGSRETRVFLPDGSSAAFRFITPLSVVVQGIGIEGLPGELVLARGEVDSTTFRLARALFDPIYGPADIDWEVSTSRSLDLDFDPESSTLAVRAPTDSSPWERLTITAVNPDGQSSSVDVDIFVNAAPALRAPAPLETMEDIAYELDLTPYLEDPDTPASRLAWEVESPPTVDVDLSGPPWLATLTPAEDWYGEARIRLSVRDQYGFSDDAEILLAVTPVNDAPVALLSPNLQLTRGKQDSSLAVAGLFDDAEDGPGGLELRWQGAEQVVLTRRGERIVVTAPASWLGSEQILLQATDRDGESVTSLLTVTVVPSLAPLFLAPPTRLGLPAGQRSVIDLAEFTSDPDDALADLTWTARTQAGSGLLIQISSTGAARVEAPPDFAGTETVQFAVVDPSGERSTFDLLIFAAPAGGEPLLAPLPSIELPAGSVDASVDLDDFVFDLDDEPAQMNWRATGAPGLEVRVDPVSHVLTVSAADSIAGLFDVGVEVSDPAGHVSTGMVPVTVRGVAGENPPADPEPPDTLPVRLSSLPSLTLTSGGSDRSIDLTQYLRGAEVGDLAWELTTGGHTQAYVDTASGRIVIFADADWTGPEIISLRGLDPIGSLVVEGLIGVQIEAASEPLELAQLGEFLALAGDTLLALPIEEVLLSAAVDPSTLVWTASAPVDVSLAADAGAGVLYLAGDLLAAPGAQLVTLRATAQDGATAEGRVLVQVLATDGSAGVESDGFDIAIVPNPLQPDYLHIYVIDSLATGMPRLRSHAGNWLDLSIEGLGRGIWQGAHVLTPGAEGEVEFLALSLDGSVLRKSSRRMQVGTATPGAGRIVGGGAAGLRLAAGSFGRDAVVAIIPAVVTATSELTPLGSAYELHATQPLQKPAILEVHAGRSGGDLYRWEPAQRRWEFVGGDEEEDGLYRARVERLGRYALFVDRVAPAVETGTDPRLLRVSDGGSGIESIRLSAAGAPLLARFDYDGQWLRLGDEIGGKIRLRVSDRAGNVAERVLRLGDTALPDGFDLAQNYPNPFNPETTIPLTLSRAGHVRVEIIDALGQRIRLLVDGELAPGRHVLRWDGTDGAGRAVASGTYLYQAYSTEGVQVRRMTLLR